MILSIESSIPTFKSVSFHAGLNVLLADTQPGSGSTIAAAAQRQLGPHAWLKAQTSSVPGGGAIAAAAYPPGFIGVS
jgi:hypothetical protein